MASARMCEVFCHAVRRSTRNPVDSLCWLRVSRYEIDERRAGNEGRTLEHHQGRE